MRDRLNLSLPAEMIGRINELAERQRLTRSAIVEAAVASFLSPDGLDQREAAFTRRLDRLARQIARIERDQRITADMLALYIRFWLTVTPPLAEDAERTAQTKGRERYDGFIQTLGRRLQKGASVLREIPDDVGDTTG